MLNDRLSSSERIFPVARVTRNLLPSLSERPSAQGLVAGLVVMSCLLFLAFNAWPTWEARSVALQRDRLETGNLSRSLAEHAHGTIQAAETILLGLRDRIEADDLATVNRERLHASMKEYMAHLPMVDGILVFDASGAWLVTSQDAAPSPAQTIADRDYFIFHREHSDRDVHVGSPVVSRAGGHWILPISLRLDGPGCVFRGVVLVTISIDFFQDFYKSFDTGRQGSISLVSDRGIIVARNPSGPGIIGSDVSKGPIFSGLRPETRVQNLDYRSIVDGIERYGTVYRVPGYPLVVTVSHGKTDALALWRSNATRYLAISGIAMAVLIFLGMGLAREVRKHEETERQYRLLADYSTDAIVCATLDGRPVYVSPAFAQLAGRGVDEWRENGWQSIVHSEDRGALIRTIAALRGGRGHGTVMFRFVQRGGACVWCEAHIGMAPAHPDEEPRIIANIRDVTERKEAEDQVAALNAELSAMAMSDGLTGLANRRRFDEKLQAEWARAVRTATPLSLIMVDVDRFKLFNDRYGHQAGDDCLRNIGAALASAVRRPEDLAARYGGEEFAVILPNTTGAGARKIAEQIRLAVQACGIEHEDNRPWGVVTASFGVATLTPKPDDRLSGVTLVEQADQALYEAKRSGRNKVADQHGPQMSEVA